MQTFLPYPDFRKSAQSLDNKRLGKQRVEAYQIWRVLKGFTKGWRRHPAVLMWEGYTCFLAMYCNACIDEWVLRGYKNNMEKLPHCKTSQVISPYCAFWLAFLRGLQPTSLRVSMDSA